MYYRNLLTTMEILTRVVRLRLTYVLRIKAMLELGY